ncbi:hypothetical protein A1Q1_01258 [Trichosporon asahii var. asahii CBS 2479]|uniref:Glycosyl transferase CAP10 domain-containing protein n=1 Tax=Trichosporon asahii var. asahii (strain ATCC 90039 / CBS 2479 / JCM 2466 / KCTC 7840 / NBRC 103889/ NCYC 2677 / UAMH 7654) TaxID=1186058 RepID=J6EYA8_TRIAS|nr:hypothetical protein A1Q1_01258 [Trichosporon asahii var. asahii CBS 2479]EJT49629.1 hypothetical protein A1Q1_01258 [Trichosporon asahii var. asahii CBS 2479]
MAAQRSTATGASRIRALGDDTRTRTPRPRADSDLDPDSEEEELIELSASVPANVGRGALGQSSTSSTSQRSSDRRANGKSSPPPPNAPSLPRSRRGTMFGRPRLLRRRRVLFALLAAALLTLLWLQHGALTREQEAEECEFKSVMDAYERDLARITGSRKQARRLRWSASDAGHTLSATGHLVLGPSGQHPIPQLLALGERRWNELLSSQSQTLGEAVAEYRRRYGRPPPAGFEKWWAFAKKHGILLPDEYDGIESDLAPFHALPLSELRKRQAEVEGWDEVFNIRIRNGSMDVDLHHGALKWGGSMPRAGDQASIISVVAKDLPDLTATFSIFDQPALYLPYGARDALSDAAREGRTLSPEVLAAAESTSGEVEWDTICSPYSPYGAEQRESAAFVYDPREAGNICSNPALLGLHGLALEPHTRTSKPAPHGRLLPLFSLAKTRVNSDIRAIPLDQFNERRPNDTAWHLKEGKLAWRGSNTGMANMSASVDWENSHRVRLHRWANSNSSSPVTLLETTMGGFVGYNTTTRPARVLQERYDVKLAQKPIQCEEEDGTCARLAQLGFAPYQSPEDLHGNRFLLDVDGNGWSGRFRRLMGTNSLVIKAGMFAEWWQDWLVPKLDYADLPSIMAFFAGPGGPNGTEVAFDDTARTLAHNGRCFAERMYRRRDVQAYMFRLLLEWARLTGNSGDFDYERWRREGGEE